MIAAYTNLRIGITTVYWESAGQMDDRFEYFVTAPPPSYAGFCYGGKPGNPLVLFSIKLILNGYGPQIRTYDCKEPRDYRCRGRFPLVRLQYPCIFISCLIFISLPFFIFVRYMLHSTRIT